MRRDIVGNFFIACVNLIALCLLTDKNNSVESNPFIVATIVLSVFAGVIIIVAVILLIMLLKRATEVKRMYGSSSLLVISFVFVSNTYVKTRKGDNNAMRPRRSFSVLIHNARTRLPNFNKIEQFENRANFRTLWAPLK